MAKKNEELEVPDLNDLLHHQNLEMESIYRAINYIEHLPADKQKWPILENRSKHLYMSWSTCSARHYQIHQLASTEEKKNRTYFQKRYYEKLEESYLATSDLISLWMSADHQHQPSMSTTPSGPSGLPPESHVKLPPLSIPTFSGKLTDWSNFKDTFESLITSNNSLSDLEKLYYLKNSVQGDANEILCNVPLVATNFMIAWNLLKTRYANTRASVNAHLNEIFSVQSLKRESASSLLNLRNIIKRNLAALENLGRPVTQYSDILINRLVERLDPRTQRDWEINLASNTNCPTYEDFDAFLLTRIRALEALNFAEPTVESHQNQSKNIKVQSKASSSRNNKAIVANSFTVSDQNIQCSICNQKHKIYKCPTFKNMSSTDRYAKIKALHLCINCLASGHRVQECPSSYTCHECQMKHHTMLHRNNGGQNIESKDTQNKSEDKCSESTLSQVESNNIQSHFSTTMNLNKKSVLLATVQVCILINESTRVQVRALLDQGSTWTFVSNKLANAMNVKRIQVSASLSGLGGSSAGTSSSIIELNLCPIHANSPIFHTQALVIPKITSYVPVKKIALEKWPHLNNIKFSDKLTSNEEIHMLIGADLYGALILNEVKKGNVNEPVAQNTVFGWVLSGPVQSGTLNDPSTISVHHCTQINQLNSAITKFWEVEDICSQQPLSPEDEFCDMHFTTTHTRQPDGRYMVRIPFKSGLPPKVGQSRHIAEKSLKRIETRLEKNHEHKSMYVQFMSEYETLQHMIPSPTSYSSSHPIVYLPHHPVFRESSQTTKLRVVFNASSKTSNGTSVNDHMLIGPKLQPDLSIVLSQWRSYPIVFTADIAKMYRQILIDPRDRNYQCILWRSSPNLQMNEYQLTTVTYGTRSAPYLALRILKQLIQDEGSNYPLASIVLNDDTFVDDLLFGAYDEHTAKSNRNEVISILEKACLTPRKWASNDISLIADLDPSNHGLAWSSLSQSENDLKVLGIAWNPDTDSFHFTVNIEISRNLTYREALSLLSQLFDPVGWISPVIIIGKMLMQKTWVNLTQWDKPLPNELEKEWLNYFRSLTDLQNISIPRWNYFHTKNTHAQLHGFSDASDRAYGAVAYLRTINESGDIQVSLIASKTKVAPIKKLTIPRLELQAAVLLAKLISSLMKVRAFSQIPIQCWSDSKIVLAWVRKHASTWKLFVANRVSEIQTLLPAHQWKHVPTQTNPTDLASRGQSPLNLEHSMLWWKGPNWLTQQPSHWPDQSEPSEEESTVEIKPIAHHLNDQSQPLSNILLKFSSWEKTIRVVAYILRFISLLKQFKIKATSETRNSNEILNRKSQSQSPSDQHLTASELSAAKVVLYRLLQQQLFCTEIKDLKLGKPVSSKSQLYSLTPFIDDQGVMRVGGRLDESDLTFDEKHPVILKKHPLVSIIIRFTHIKCLHGGMKLTLSTLRQQVWIINPRPQIKSVLFQCLACVRIRAALASQIMSNLPISRITKQERAFVHCGIDYAGPIQVRLASGRGHKSHACYIAVFICLTVKAIHLELASDYSSATFIASYKRFCARHGIPKHMYSDQGTTFQGASRLLEHDFTEVVNGFEFRALLATDNVTWHFIAPAAPHFGGIWEAGVKSVKTHLKRVLLGKTPTIEELSTLLCQIEAVLNSRPIAPYTDSIDDLNPLTPGHFLIGGPINAVPQESLLDLKENRLTRWQLMQQTFEKFWKYWSNDYRQSLQHRTKWQISKVPIEIGQMVLLRKPNLPPSKWNLARIIDCYPGRDGVTRVVKLKTIDSEYARPITELTLLPVDLNENKN